MSRAAVLPIHLLVLLLLALPARAAEVTATLRLAAEWDTENRASPYYVASPTVAAHPRSDRQDLQLSLRQGGFLAQGSLRGQLAEGRQPEPGGVIQQFHYDGELGDGWGYTVGRKLMSWGVGFGFKPLDVVQREDRRGLNPPPLVGVPLLALARYTADTAWTLAWTRPGGGEDSRDSRDESLALYGYRLAGDDDLHGVLRLSRRRGLEAGVGATRVVGEEWSFHGAALVAARHRPRLNGLVESGGVLAAADPLAEGQARRAARLVAGAQWTGAAGVSVLAEAWYDGEAYRRADWRRLDELTARQRALAGLAPAAAIDGNVAWSSQAYLATNLLRENLLLRVAYEDEGFRPYGELLVTPRDGGCVATLGASYEGNRQRLSLGLRRAGGAAGSAYAQAPVKRALWAEWRMALF